MAAPQNLKYTADHEWVRVDGDVATVGITDYAQSALGDVVFVELPDLGEVTASSVIGEIESTKSVGELFAPVTGEIIEVNDAVVANPELVNSDPYGDGWLVRVRVAELPELLDAEAYEKLTGE
ncbi:glycine cleavage system protein GcvH [Gryllotalpicola ginsengisoli]|uniref:glycine cleavage system protein GcvH n=1 Tax=Gryllotalpicola ginsengisoli TaxID=444608 RepID=UPI0003B5C942|nr:glycine cleavage system protein GcvH [Gryllotalpicola ginsengisoli]